MSRLRIRLSQPNLAEVGVGAELGKNTNKHFLAKGADSYHYPHGGGVVHLTLFPIGGVVEIGPNLSRDFCLYFIAKLSPNSNFS